MAEATEVAEPGGYRREEMRREYHVCSPATAGVIDLVPGADRGTITQPLLEGTIAITGQKVFFVITDASDKDLR